MDDEIEDIVGDVKYSDSMKSIATRSSLALCSADFNDLEASSRCSEKYQSSGRTKATYVIECDSDDSGRDCSVLVPEKLSEPNYKSAMCGSSEHAFTKCASTSYHTLVAQEIHTQTSKTIMELAESERNSRKICKSQNLQTQTSYMSITERTVEYRIQVSSVERFSDNEINNDELPTLSIDTSAKESNLTNVFSCENTCKSPSIVSQENNEEEKQNNGRGDELDCNTDDEVSQIANDQVDHNSPKKCLTDLVEADNYNQDIEPFGGQDEDCEDHSSEYDEDFPSDMDEDSLTQECNKNPDVEELHQQISINYDLCFEKFGEPDIRRFGTLTPLAEESSKKSLLDALTSNRGSAENQLINDELVFTDDTGMKIKLLKEDGDEKVKLPPIQSCPVSPIALSSWVAKPNLSKAGTLPSLIEKKSPNRWEIETKNLAAGESTLISQRSVSPKPLSALQLPPISGEPLSTNRPVPQQQNPPTEGGHDTISIKRQIKELKQNSAPWKGRCSSPGSSISPDRREQIAQLGCETIVTEVLKKLRSDSWFEVINTLSTLPDDLERFWGVISEMRVADLIRQVNVHVESPRPQVARVACGTVAAILRNTSYTKKPDFYETVTLLLSKTGSYSRVVRRAANVALDHIVCGVDLSHAVTALCLHGVGHKNALVRCASARLLVVSCALAGGGRRLLRGRPSSAATARRLALNALASLLDDRNTDTRKYAERLFAMLRPLTNFEAYYLTDVEVETASRQMKKYDQILFCSQSKDSR